MSETKIKGDLAELMVMADLAQQGFKVALPFGDDWDYDLIVSNSGKLERIQIKYRESDGDILKVKCVSYTIAAGKQTGTKKYTSETIDWLAVYDKTTNLCFYFPSHLLGEGKAALWFRLNSKDTRRCSSKTRFAGDYGRLTERPIVPVC